MWTVTRQCQWPEGNYVVEVSEGGLDYTNPDALVEEYEGEFQEFADPREAVKTAIRICEQWRKDGQINASIGVGVTMGFSIPFEDCSFEYALKWAEEKYEKLEKCARCGEIMEDAKEWWYGGDQYSNGDFLLDQDLGKFCSESCAEHYTRFWVQCSVCGEWCDVKTAHEHDDDKWIGECCYRNAVNQ